MDDLLAFTPVPSRARHDGWTPDRQRAFVHNLAALGLVGAAARAVGMSAKSAYRLRERAGAGHPFAAAWDAALDEGRAKAIDAAITRAIDGVPVPVFYGGRQVGEWRRYSDNLLLTALRHHTRTRADRTSDPFGSSDFPADGWGLS